MSPGAVFCYTMLGVLSKGGTGMRSDRSEMRVSAALIALFLMTFLLSGGGPKHWFSGSSNTLSAAMVLLWMTEIERRVLHQN